METVVDSVWGRFAMLLFRRALGFVGGLFLVSVASADVPRLLNYQGRLTDGSGNCFTGTVALRLRFYDAVAGGNALFDETQPAVAVNQGLFTLKIGSATSGGVPDSALDAAQAFV